MNGTKSALKSLGIMGPLISLIVLGINWKWPAFGLTEGDIVPVIDAGATLFGLLTGMIGRWRATRAVSLTGT